MTAKYLGIFLNKVISNPNKVSTLNISMKAIANLYWGGGDMESWFEGAVAGSKDPKIKQKQLEAMWNWGTYLITRRHIKLIEVDPSLSLEKKEEKIKWYQKNKPPFPKDITFFIGAKRIIKEEENKQSKKTKKQTKEEEKAETIQSEVMRQVEANEPEVIKWAKKWIFGD